MRMRHSYCYLSSDHLPCLVSASTRANTRVDTFEMLEIGTAGLDWTRQPLLVLWAGRLELRRTTQWSLPRLPAVASVCNVRPDRVPLQPLYLQR